MYMSSPKSSKTNHRRKASDDLTDQPAQKKSNQKTKNDLSDAEKRKNFLERNRQGMIIITSILFHVFVIAVDRSIQRVRLLYTWISHTEKKILLFLIKPPSNVVNVRNNGSPTSKPRTNI